jgi:hypothetical protein
MNHKFLLIAGTIGFLFILFGAWKKIVHQPSANIVPGFWVYYIQYFPDWYFMEYINANFTNHQQKSYGYCLPYLPMIGSLIYLFFNKNSAEQQHKCATQRRCHENKCWLQKYY